MDKSTMDEKISYLSEACVGIRVELAGMKEVLGKLSSNQEDLIQLRERSMHLEQVQNKSEKIFDAIFTSIRELEQMRIESRIVALEESRKWIVITGAGAAVTIICGTIVAIVRKGLVF